MKTIRIEKVVIDLKTGTKTEMFAFVSQNQTPEFHTYTLTYEGYRTDWMVA